MTDIQYVKVVNECEDEVRVFLRRPRPKKKSKGLPAQPSSYTLRPNEESPPLPYHELIGARGWDSIQSSSCIHIVELEFSPRFLFLTNISSTTVTLEVTPATSKRRRQSTTVTIEPEGKSRSIDIKSVRKPSELRKLEAQKNVRIQYIREIGPSTGRQGAVGSWVGQSVYICYECGGPIVFRGNPPRPIHL